MEVWPSNYYLECLFPHRLYVTYLYKDKPIIVVLNRCRRPKRMSPSHPSEHLEILTLHLGGKNIYGPFTHKSKRSIWRRQREEDRRQKEHRLKQQTWFMYHGDRAEEEDAAPVVFRRTSAGKADRNKVKNFETRDEWRTNLKPPKDMLIPFNSQSGSPEVQPSLRDPKDWWTDRELLKKKVSTTGDSAEVATCPLLSNLLTIAL